MGLYLKLSLAAKLPHSLSFGMEDPLYHILSVGTRLGRRGGK